MLLNSKVPSDAKTQFSDIKSITPERSSEKIKIKILFIKHFNYKTKLIIKQLKRPRPCINMNLEKDMNPTNKTTQPNVDKTLSPNGAVQKETPAQPQTQSPNPSSAVILLVEDDPVLSKMYGEKFKFEGFNVLSAGNGEDGLKMALGEKVDLILLDLMLPRLSGNELLAKLREDEKGKNITVIALTNLAEQEEKDRAMQLGVKEYLIKAMQTPEEVVNKVKSYLGKS